LASQSKIHPKVISQALKLAFLAPEVAASVLTGESALELVDLRNISALSWQGQREDCFATRKKPLK
jgi:hypothetical protein